MRRGSTQHPLLVVSTTDARRERRSRNDRSDAGVRHRAHAEFFGEHRPAATMAQVVRLIDDAFLIEIEADAVAG